MEGHTHIDYYQYISIIVDMDLGNPFRVVTPTVDGAVLGVLARATTDFTPPEVQRLLDKFSVDGVRKALVRLTGQGVVLKHGPGNASLYRLNRDHLAASAIIELSQAKERLLERLRTHVGSWTTPCDYGAMFGSAARGTMRSDSDIDLFVVRPRRLTDDAPWTQQLLALARDVHSWTGNDARILEYGADELDDSAGTRDAVVSAVRQEGLHFAGPANYLGKVGKVVAD
jgi:predicted nucleotidyltransferase